MFILRNPCIGFLSKIGKIHAVDLIIHTCGVHFTGGGKNVFDSSLVQGWSNYVSPVL